MFSCVCRKRRERGLFMQVVTFDQLAMGYQSYISADDVRDAEKKSKGVVLCMKLMSLDIHAD